MTTGIKIWLTAQALTSIVFLFFFAEAAIIATPFTVIGGLPAALLFEVWFWLIKDSKRSPGTHSILSSLAIPCITAANAIVFDNMLDGVSSEFPGIILAAVASSFVATLIFMPGYFKRLQAVNNQRQAFIDNIAQQQTHL